MPTIQQHLSQFREACPTWLAEFGPGSSFNPAQFFGSRVVFYPGSGFDGQAVKLFGSSHAAHCFVYADYLLEEEFIRAELDNPALHGHFSGYHTLARLQLNESQIMLGKWVPHAVPEGTWTPPRVTPYGFLEVLERDQNRDDEYGVHRLAILFLGADGHAAYDALFCQGNGAPYAVMVVDHGFGGNYSRFGRDGQMEEIAQTSGTWPQWQVVAHNSKAWRCFEAVSDIDGNKGGMYGTLRHLYQNIGHHNGELPD